MALKVIHSLMCHVINYDYFSLNIKKTLSNLRGTNMARLTESKQTIDAIKKKALSNAMRLGTYKTRSVFTPGRSIISFSEICAKVSRRGAF